MLAGCQQAKYEKELQQKAKEADCKAEYCAMFTNNIGLAVESDKHKELKELRQACLDGFSDEKVSCDSVQKLVNKFNKAMHIHLTK